MPLVTLTVRKPQTAAFKTTVLDAVHAALVAVGVPETDKFQHPMISGSIPVTPTCNRPAPTISRWSRSCGRPGAASR